MPSLFLLRALALFLALPLPASAQLVRQAATTLSALPAELPTASGYTTSNALGNLTFTLPIATAYPAGETNRLYVIQKGGLMRVVNNLSTTPAASDFMNLGTHLTSVGTPLATADERGLLAIAFHPNYQNNGYFYLFFSLNIGNPSQLHQRLARFQATLPATGGYLAATTANPATMTPLLTIYDQASNHNGGELQFGTDGYLYLSLGDEGGGGDTYNNSRFINKDFWGQLIRIDVDNKLENLAPNAHEQPDSTSHPSAIHAGTYKVPADNPFIGATTWHNAAVDPTKVRTEIFATGLRNPFRFSIDPPTGRIFLGDVGQDGVNAREEVNIIVPGGDYGWSWRQGSNAYTGGPSPTSYMGPSGGFNPINPIFEYDNTNNGTGSGNDHIVYGTSVIGGIVYRGNQLTELQGAYLFAEHAGNNAIVALRETSPGIWQAERLTTRTQIAHFGRHPATGEPLLTGLNVGFNGVIFRLQRSGTQGDPPPASLSGTGAFSNLANLTPAAGVVPYTPNVAFWSDYAHKSRWFGIKNTTDTIGYSTDGNWTFPTGTVWVKHFDFDLERGNPATRRRLETRFLVKTATDIYGLSYQWNNLGGGTQTDATLVAEEGANLALPGATPAQTWRFPSRGECKTCHTPIGGFALSFNTRQLNRAALIGSQMLNQIAALRDATLSGGAVASYFTAGTAPATTNHLPQFSPASDTTASLEHRVRSYLAVNCVQCHQPGGAAQGNWDARPHIATDSANLVNGALINQLGDPAARFLVPITQPGDVDHAMALRRLQGFTASRMPPLATSQRDLVAEQLLTDWMTQHLPSRQSFSQWQLTHFNSTSSAPAQPAADPDGDGQRNSLEFLQNTSPVVPTPVLAVGGAGFSGNDFSLQFDHPANRSCLVETTTDLQTWTLWDVPGNAPFFPQTTLPRTLTGPAAGPSQFFRLRLGER